MSVGNKRSRTFDAEESLEIERMLQKMVSDNNYNTEPTYSANIVDHPSNLIPFVDKHLNYLKSHPRLNPRQYIANLRLMTRIR